MAARLPSFAFSLGLVFLGALAVLAQTLFVRETLCVFFGNEIVLGVTLAAWFLGIALGAAAASVLRSADPLRRLVTAFAALLLVLVGSLVQIRLGRRLLGVGPGELVPFTRLLLLSLTAITPCSFVVGFLFPAASAVAARLGRAGAGAIAWVYVAESMGSLLGGMLCSLVLLPRLPAFAAAAILGAGALASLALLLFARGRRAAPLAVAATLIAALLGLGAFSRLDAWSVGARFRSFRTGLTLRLSRDSPYQNIAIAGDGPSVLLTNGQVAASFPDAYGNAARAHPLMLEHPAPRNVLLLGGGMTGLAREVLRHPVTLLHLVESDPWLPEAVRRFLPPEDRAALGDPRVTLHVQDPLRFLAQARDRYDLCILGLPDPTTASINRFYTREFFERCKRVLAPGGVLVTRVSSASNYLGGAALDLPASIYWTLRDVFGTVLATPSEECFLLASDDPSAASLDPEVLKARLRARKLDLPLFHPEQLDLWLPGDRVGWLQKRLDKASGVPRNTTLRPVSYFYGLLLWDRFSGGKRSYALSRLANAHPLRLVLPASLLLALMAGIVVASPDPRRRRWQALCAITTTGFASIAWMLVLLLCYQTLFGSLYQEVALLVALFMLGLALGAEGMRRLASIPSLAARASRLVLLSDATVASFSILIVPAIALLTRSGPGIEAGAGFVALLLMAGLLTGAQFPAAAALYQSATPDLERSSGRIDAADHLGAMAGAFLTGVLLLPLGGVVGAAAAVTLAKLASLLALARPTGGK